MGKVKQWETTQNWNLENRVLKTQNNYYKKYTYTGFVNLLMAFAPGFKIS